MGCVARGVNHRRFFLFEESEQLGVVMVAFPCASSTEAATFGAREFHRRIVSFPALDIGMDGVVSPQVSNQCGATSDKRPIRIIGHYLPVNVESGSRYSSMW